MLDRNNVARIVLFYEDLNFERIVQTPAFTVSRVDLKTNWLRRVRHKNVQLFLSKLQTISFISNLGGLFGLWVGISVLSLCEWLEFLLRLAMTFVWRKNAVENSKP